MFFSCLVFEDSTALFLRIVLQKGEKLALFKASLDQIMKRHRLKGFWKLWAH